MMKVVVVYESMYGNTHLVAEAIGAGAGEAGAKVAVVPVGAAVAELLEGADLVVAGGPTHAHGLSRASTRKAAAEAARKSDGELSMDPDAPGAGMREWLDALGEIGTNAAAFDTRIDAPPVLTGRASKHIAKELRRHGANLLTEPESFLVTKQNRLEPDEERHAREWGAKLAQRLNAGERVETPR